MALVLHSQNGRCHKVVLGLSPNDCLMFLVAGLLLVLRLESFLDRLVGHFLSSCKELTPHFGIQASSLFALRSRALSVKARIALSVPFRQSKKRAVVHFLLLRDPGLAAFEVHNPLLGQMKLMILFCRFQVHI